MDRFEKILALLRCELWGEPLACEIAADDIDRILAMAEEQGVSGLVANAILANDLPIGALKTVDVCTVTRLHELKSREMNRKVARFAGFLNRRNLKYVVMKGQTMAVLYPHPMMRSCGDIDFYCPKDSFAEVQRVIEERLGVTMHHNWSERHDNFEVKEVLFEMHSDMTLFSAPSHRRYWDSFIDKALESEPCTVAIDETEVKTLSPTLDALYIFAHMFGHFTSGCSLKQLCDWAMVLHRYRNDIRKEELEKHLRGLGMWRAYLAIGAWLVERLGLPEEAFPFALSDNDRRWVERLNRNFQKMRGKSLELDKKVGGHHVSVMHTLKTASLVVHQTLRFFPLAPKEMLWTFPAMAAWSVRKRVM